MNLFVLRLRYADARGARVSDWLVGWRSVRIVGNAAAAAAARAREALTLYLAEALASRSTAAAVSPVPTTHGSLAYLSKYDVVIMYILYKEIVKCYRTVPSHTSHLQ